MTREEQIYKKAEGDCIAMLESIERGDIIKGSICPQSYRAGFMDGAKWADQHPQWIPVEEELPTGQPDENGRTSNYLCFCTGGAYRMANFADGLWWDCDEDTDNEDSVEWYVVYDVTHWMPMPVQPRKEE